MFGSLISQVSTLFSLVQSQQHSMKIAVKYLGAGWKFHKAVIEPLANECMSEINESLKTQKPGITQFSKREFETLQKLAQGKKLDDIDLINFGKFLIEKDDMKRKIIKMYLDLANCKHPEI